VYYIFTSYVTADLIIIVYTRSAAVVNIPYINPVINFSVMSMRIACESTVFNWACHFRAKIHILMCDVSNLAILDY
jgi:hypothetical protein